jgi:hypothetical protein
MTRQISLSLVALILCLLNSGVTEAGPLKVYILAGQSNMQGHAHVRTIDHIGMDPATAPILKEIRNTDGTDRVFENIWISALGVADEELHGKLTTGYGAAGGGPKIGPELTFGIYMQQHLQEPILIIKTAWGGKSLHTDFRSPSAGPYQFNEQQLQGLKKQGKDIEQIRQDRVTATGVYYRLMLQHVNDVLKNIERVYPDYDSKAGYELSGFVWFQGWNDMVDQGVYPKRDMPGGYDAYSSALAHFIRDVRKDLSSPKLPFVIGVMGAGGPVDKYSPDRKRYAPIHSEFRKAMAAPASLPEFKGNVKAVLTEESWDLQLTELTSRWGKVQGKNRSLNNDKTLNPEQRKQQLDEFTNELFTAEALATLKSGTSNAEYHYLGSAKILARIGKSFADAIVSWEE